MGEGADGRLLGDTPSDGSTVASSDSDAEGPPSATFDGDGDRDADAPAAQDASKVETSDTHITRRRRTDISSPESMPS